MLLHCYRPLFKIYPLNSEETYLTECCLIWRSEMPSDAGVDLMLSFE